MKQFEKFEGEKSLAASFVQKRRSRYERDSRTHLNTTSCSTLRSSGINYSLGVIRIQVELMLVFCVLLMHAVLNGSHFDPALLLLHINCFVFPTVLRTAPMNFCAASTMYTLLDDAAIISELVHRTATVQLHA